MVGQDFAQEQGLPLEKPIHLIGTQRMLSYYLTLELNEEAPADINATLTSVLEAPLATAERLGLPMTGEIYNRVLFSSHEGGKRVLHLVIYVMLSSPSLSAVRDKRLLSFIVK
jgi:hypothetical protein